MAARVGQLFMTQSYKYLPVRTGSILGMLEPMPNFIVGVMIFGKVLSGRTVFGTALIIDSCVVVLFQRAGDIINKTGTKRIAIE